MLHILLNAGGEEQFALSIAYNWLELLQQFEIEVGNERDAYYTDEEYAASILALSVEELRDQME